MCRGSSAPGRRTTFSGNRGMRSGRMGPTPMIPERMASGGESRKQSVFNLLALLRAKEGIDLFVNGSRAFEIGEVSAAFQRDHAGIWNCLSNVLSRSDGNEFVVARND